MDTVVDVIPTGESVLPVKADSTAPVDLLGRQEVVDRIMKILEIISENKSSCTFALNGAWGTGKTFVLKMLMNHLWEYHSDKYIVFHYNCWQYDYYEEPLIALVAAMLDSVDDENHLLPANVRDKAKAGMELAKPVLKKIATNFVKNRIGIDLTDVVSTTKDYKEALDDEEQKRADSHSFDEFYSFKKAIGQAQDEICKLAKDRTLVVVVDELDRCLPDYSIKVLERLHHMFGVIENSAILLAVDKSQLDKTVSQTFGDGTDTTKYLRKFVNFELELSTGEINGNFWEKYADYFGLFDPNMIDTDFPFEDFINALFSGIDMRTQERLMDRIKTVHRILSPDEKKDYSVMCGELMYSVFSEIYGIKGPEIFARRQNESTDSTLLNIEYAITPPIPERIINHYSNTWTVRFNLLTNTYPNLITYSLRSNKCCPGGIIIIQELLTYYLLNLFTLEKDKIAFEFFESPTPKHRNSEYWEVNDEAIACELAMFGTYYGEIEEINLLIEDSFTNNRKNLASTALDNLIKCAKVWLKHYANINLEYLYAFQDLFNLLR